MQRIIKIVKGVTIGFLSLMILSVIIAYTFGEDTPTENGIVEQTMITEDTPEETPPPPSKETPPAVTEQPSLDIYTINGDDSLFEGYTDARVEIWASNAHDTLSDSRTLVTKLKRGTEVELLQRDSDNWYCKIKKANHVGWLACDWLEL